MRHRAPVGISAAWRPAAFGALAIAIAIAAAILFAPATAAQESGALVRFAHLSLDAEAVDVYVDGEVAFPGVEYKGVSQYMELPAGQHEVAVRPAGAQSGAAPLANVGDAVQAGPSTVALIGPGGDYALTAYADDFSPPPSGQVKLRAIHAGVRTNADAVDVYVNGQPAFTNLAYGEVTEYVTLPGGTFAAEVRAAGTETVLVAASNVVGQPGAVVTFAGVGSGDTGYEFLPILDAAGAGTAPEGGVATGAGGTADTAWPSQVLVAVGALAGFATLSVGRSRSRRQAAWRGEV